LPPPPPPTEVWQSCPTRHLCFYWQLMAQVVTHGRPTTEDRVLSQACPCKMYCKQNGTWTGFCPIACSFALYHSASATGYHQRCVMLTSWQRCWITCGHTRLVLLDVVWTVHCDGTSIVCSDRSVCLSWNRLFLDLRLLIWRRHITPICGRGEANWLTYLALEWTAIAQSV